MDFLILCVVEELQTIHQGGFHAFSKNSITKYIINQSIYTLLTKNLLHSPAEYVPASLPNRANALEIKPRNEPRDQAKMFNVSFLLIFVTNLVKL